MKLVEFLSREGQAIVNLALVTSIEGDDDERITFYISGNYNISWVFHTKEERDRVLNSIKQSYSREVE